MKLLGVVFGLMFVTMMSALWLEYRYSRRRGLGWHVPADTLTNLNLAGGRMAVGVLGTGLLLAIYAWIAQRPLFELDHVLPWWLFWPLGLLLTELVQYWTHRLAHRWHWLGWAHLTHHSSSYLNLSTSMRISWIYRYYIFFAYLPLAWLGYGVLEFVAFQGILNGYNQFMHTRARIPYGPLSAVLVSPEAHRLHHVRDPRWAGNYGAMFSIYDHLFGTYRALPDPTMESTLTYGMEHNHDTADLIALNLAPLRNRAVDDGLGEVSGLAWVLLVPYTAIVMAGVTQQANLGLGAQIGMAVVGVLLAGSYAFALRGPLRRAA